MHFTTGALVSLGFAAVHGLPLAPTDFSGCRVDLAPTLNPPQNAASNILYHTLSKWVKTTSTTYFSSDYLDTRNTTKAPFSVTFKANVIPNFQSDDELSTVLNTWLGTYLVGGASPARDDYVVTGVTCS
ncbi:hypothetical protein F4801DRAFT_203646 [Xylaria longipes]|nr:hypothetical protein F4801DRAFT_203646 [Xylaria longipes]RYC59450.1 hypothetical protein CHU98_g6739 [Xylaria longipes]